MILFGGSTRVHIQNEVRRAERKADDDYLRNRRRRSMREGPMLLKKSDKEWTERQRALLEMCSNGPVPWPRLGDRGK